MHLHIPPGWKRRPPGSASMGGTPRAASTVERGAPLSKARPAIFSGFARIRFRAKRKWWFSRTGAQRSEEHTSELQSLMRISYAVFCLKKKTRQYPTTTCGQITAQAAALTHQQTH